MEAKYLINKREMDANHNKILTIFGVVWFLALMGAGAVVLWPQITDTLFRH